MKYFLVLSFLTSLCFAGDPTPEEKFLVKSVDGTDVKSLAAPNVKILPAHRGVANSSNLPSIADRNQIFEKSGLAASIENWDDFDKDSLYLKLQKKGSGPIERVLAKHPDLSRAAFEKAQELIAKEQE
jgi:hypothetical protein